MSFCTNDGENGNILTKALPTFLTPCPHFLRSDSTREKTGYFGAKKVWNGAEIFFVALSHIQMVYLKKKLAKIGQFYPRHWRKESSGRYMGLPPPTR